MCMKSGFFRRKYGKCLLYLCAAMSNMFLVINPAVAQKRMPYEGNWGCSFVIGSSYIDLKAFEQVKIHQNRIYDTKFTPKQSRKNTYEIKLSTGALVFFSILDPFVMLIENSEQTQVCLRQEDKN